MKIHTAKGIRLAALIQTSLSPAVFGISGLCVSAGTDEFSATVGSVGFTGSHGSVGLVTGGATGFNSKPFIHL